MAERCSKVLLSGYIEHQCYRKGVVCRNGKWYCKQHDPGDPEKAQTWWRANPFNITFPVEAVQVVDETANRVRLLNGHVIHKNLETAWVRPTFEEAKACLVGYYERKIIDYTSQIKYAERGLAAARKLEEPK